MTRHVLFAAALILGLWSATSAKPVPAPKAPDFSKLKEISIKKWSGAEVLLTGKITQAISGPVGLSDPPVYTFRLQIKPDKMLRGSAKPEQISMVNYSIRQKDQPTFPSPDKQCLIALKFVGKMWILQSVEEASTDVLEQAPLATSFPLGWTIQDGKLVSPWVKVAKVGQAEGPACSITGRPVLLAGEGVRFRAEPVAPKKVVQFGNPDGDGEYQLTVENETKNEIEVPALLTDGKTIRWDESIIIRCEDKAYPIPGAVGQFTGLKSVVLKPGESVTGVVQALGLQGPAWPRGGSRVEFQFCLGEKSVTRSFYYLSRHHDPIREAVLKGLKK